MNITYGEQYLKSLDLINDTSIDTCIGFELPILSVMAIEDGQHFVQLFGITREEPASKFMVYLNFKFSDFEKDGNNDHKKILDILYLRRPNKAMKFDPQHENFLRFLGNKFNLGYPANYTMKEDVRFRYICLSNNLVTLEDFFTNKLALKLFHENPYYELYLNVDFPNKKVEFCEKDEEYREHIFNSLMAEANLR